MPVPFHARQALVFLAAFPFFLGGCVDRDAAAPAASNEVTAESVLAAYHPRTVRLFHIDVNATVEEPFPEDWGHQTYRASFYTLNATPYTLDPKVLLNEHMSAVWNVHDNDTVIYGTYRLNSNKHRVFDEHLAVGDHTTATINLGGIDFRVVPISDSRAWGVFGPFNIYTSPLTLPYLEDHPLPQRVSIPHESVFPMLEQDGTFNGKVAFEKRYVNATVTFTYWGKGSYRIADESFSKAEIELLRSRLVPEKMGWGRFGQYSSWCSGFVLKAPAPCMNPWERPLV